ncbi:MAG: amidase domain-containing protein [Propionibacteriaceae bacterium]|nr:amidase domain-containing protein [Propionibacteriaceae bacterium]
MGHQGAGRSRRTIIAALSAVVLAVTGLMGARPAQAQSPNEDELRQTGAALEQRLEHIEAVGFGLPQESSQDESNPLALSPAAEETLAEAETHAKQRSAGRKERGLVLLSSNVSLASYEVIEETADVVRVSYKYLHVRELPELQGDDSWQEISEHEVTLDPDSGMVKTIIIKDRDYYDALAAEEEVSTGEPGSLDGPSTELNLEASSAPQDDPEAAAPQELSSAQRQNVADCALQWWNSKNDNYPMDYANDCTNFTSQALHAGGWQFQYGLWRSNWAWWGYNRRVPPKASYPWGGAENFYRYAAQNTGRTSIHRYMSQIRVGDILQYRADGYTNMNHSMVVTKKDSRTFYLTYHTDDTRNRPFTDIDPTGKTWYAHKV